MWFIIALRIDLLGTSLQGNLMVTFQISSGSIYVPEFLTLVKMKFQKQSMKARKRL